LHVCLRLKRAADGFAYLNNNGFYDVPSPRGTGTHRIVQVFLQLYKEHFIVIDVDAQTLTSTSILIQCSSSHVALYVYLMF